MAEDEPANNMLLTLGVHARSEGNCSCLVCLCVCVCMCVCVYVCVSVRSLMSTHASRPRNIGTYMFTAIRKNFLNCDFY